MGWQSDGTGAVIHVLVLGWQTFVVVVTDKRTVFDKRKTDEKWAGRQITYTQTTRQGG